MFQRFIASVSHRCAKVNRDVAYVAMAIHVCCKCIFQMFQLFSSGCCMCVYVDVAKVDWDVLYVATRMLKAFVPNVSVVFSDVCCKCVYLNVVCV